MRVLFLTDSYRPARSACANRVTCLVEAMRDMGIDVVVLASSDSLIGASETETHSYVHYFRTVPLGRKTLIARLRNNFSGISASVKAAYKLGDFDVVICTTPPLTLTSGAIKIAKMKKAKLVLDIRDIWPDVAYEIGKFSPTSPFGVYFEHLCKKSLSFADLVITVSPGKVEKIARRLGSDRMSDLVCIPNGVDESFAKIEEDRATFERYFQNNENDTCVYVGNIGVAQGLGDMLSLASARPSVRFLVFGDGAEAESLKDRAARDGLSNVYFCGKIDARGVRTVLRHASLAYVPLVNSNLKDSIPSKLYESLACGCPVLLVAAGDSVALLEETGLGEHAVPKDIDSITAAFDVLLGNSYTREKKDAVSRYMFERHSRQSASRRFAKVLLERYQDENNYE